MSRTTLDLFQGTIHKTDVTLKDIRDCLNLKELNQAYLVLKAVLHAVRDRVMPNEAVDLAAQLPALIRGFYYEGWQPVQTPVKMNQAEFFNRIIDDIPFEVYCPAEDIVKAVLGALNKFISKGELEDIKGEFPKSLSEIFPEEMTR
ncbi:MAG: DUF2267 domain-containing protein [bacterium]|nr:DUF2267 domain-containing protein [bacterium]